MSSEDEAERKVKLMCQTWIRDLYIYSDNCNIEKILIFTHCDEYRESIQYIHEPVFNL